MTGLYVAGVSLGIVVILGLLALFILSLIGLGFLTPLAFGKKKYEDLSKTQQNLMKLFVVLTWIALGLPILALAVSLIK